MHADGDPGAVLPSGVATLVRGIDRIMAPFWNSTPLYLVLVAIAVGASWWGFTAFYGSQFARTPVYTWPFVPDSPLATTAWIPASLLLKAHLDRRPGIPGAAVTLFVLWAAVMNAKVGLWTVFVLLYHYDHFFAGDTAHIILEWTLVASHLGMVAFGVFLFRKVRTPAGGALFAVLALAFLWDFMDYGFARLVLDDPTLRLWPNGVPAEKIDVVAGVSLALSVLSVGALAVGLRLRGPPVAR